MSAAIAADATAAVDPLAILAAMTTGKGAKKKRAADAEANVEGLEGLIAKWKAACDQRDAYAGLATSLEEQIRSAGREARVQHCRTNRKVVASVVLNKSVMLTQQCRYSPVPHERANELKEAFGVESYQRFFEEKLKISVTEGAAADNEFLVRLITLFGAEEFPKRFVAERSIKVTKEFHEAVTLDPAVAAKAAPFIASEVIKNAQASIVLA